MSEKSDSAIQMAVSATTSSLVAFGLCVAVFLPPFSRTITNSVAFTVIAGLGIGISCILHFIFVGITAHRMGRPVARWVLLALITFPLGSITGLIVLHWFSEEKQQVNPDSR
ncbi:MAG: hypothetical protein V4634_02500 [Pseudomonadota bacterium]